jgi:hypothetical protein
MGETTDLSKAYPEKFTEMLDEWDKFKIRTGTIPFQKGERTDTD